VPASSYEKGKKDWRKKKKEKKEKKNARPVTLYIISIRANFPVGRAGKRKEELSRGKK